MPRPPPVTNPLLPESTPAIGSSLPLKRRLTELVLSWLALTFEHVSPRRRAHGRMRGAAHRWRSDPLARPRAEPLDPVRPPAAGVLRGARHPFVGARRFPLVGPVPA